jgi:hypothetical protein
VHLEKFNTISSISGSTDLRILESLYTVDKPVLKDTQSAFPLQLA